MTPLPDSEYEKIERLAEKARPGPWRAKGDWIYASHGISIAQAYAPTEAHAVVEIFSGADDAAYIAALSPNVVLAMVAERRALREALERARGCINGLLARTPVRDVTETLAEIDAALNGAAHD